MHSTTPAAVGRIVHYVARGSADGAFPPVCRAAIITETHGATATTVGLAVLNPTGLFLDRDIDHDPGRTLDEVDTEVQEAPEFTVVTTVACANLAPDYPDDAAQYRPGTWHWPEHTTPSAPALEDDDRSIDDGSDGDGD